MRRASPTLSRRPPATVLTVARPTAKARARATRAAAGVPRTRSSRRTRPPPSRGNGASIRPGVAAPSATAWRPTAARSSGRVLCGRAETAAAGYSSTLRPARIPSRSRANGRGRTSVFRFYDPRAKLGSTNKKAKSVPTMSHASQAWFHKQKSEVRPHHVLTSCAYAPKASF
jgi:hypothetical protein